MLDESQVEYAIVNLEAEEHVLGAAMIRDSVMDVLLNDVRLQREHFYRGVNRDVWQALVGLYDRQEPRDAVTVWAELELQGLGEERERQGRGQPRHSLFTYPGGPQDLKMYVQSLPSQVPVIGNAEHYGQLVLAAAKWRHYRAAGLAIVEAARNYDEQGLAAAEAMLATDIVRAGELITPEMLKAQLVEHLTAEKPDVFPWPFKEFNDKTGGQFRGQVTLVSGWTSHGKSVLVDQMLETVAKRGYRVCLYINEMQELERVARLIAKHTGVPMPKIMAAKLDEGELRDVLAEADRLPFPIVNVAGWSAEDITHHARRHRWDYVGMDILHEIPYEDEKDLRLIGSAFNRLAKMANCHVVYTGHLSEHRAHKAQLPLPVESDVRGSGMLKNQVDFLCFVYLDRSGEEESVQNEQGEGYIYLAKGRSTGRVGFRAKLHPARFRWEAMGAGGPPGHRPAATPPLEQGQVQPGLGDDDVI